MTRPIRAFLTGLFFLWSALIPSAQEIGELQGYWVGATATPATITFLQCAVDLGNLSAYTFTAQNVGPATPDRYTIVGVGGKDGASVYTVSSVTVGGDSATISVDNGASANNTESAIAIVANPSGTSEDVVVTFSENITDAVICLWQANDLSSGVATDTATSTAAAGAAITLDTDTTADGIAVGVCSADQPSITFVWTGLTERADASTGEGHSYTAADFDEDGTAATPLGITCDPSGNNSSGAVAAYR